jgi:aminoglycoside N3'-acetyltransferase
MININQFTDTVWKEFKKKFEYSSYFSPSAVPLDHDLVESGILDSMDLLTLALAVEKYHALSMDFSIFSGKLDCSLQGLYSSLVDEQGHNSNNDQDDLVSKLIAELGIGGVKAGDSLFIHSSLSALGMNSGDLNDFYRELRVLVGDSGTIFAPAANIEAFFEENFDPQLTSVQTNLGALSEHIRNLPGAIRSGNAFDAVVGVGPLAVSICGHDNEVCYGENSPWKKMLRKDVKLLMLGVSFFYASIVHAVELDCKVPYRFWKNFPGSIIINGTKTNFTVKLYAAERKIIRHYDKLLDLPEISNHVYISQMASSVFLIPLDVVYDAAFQAIKKNPNYFISYND